MSGQSKEEMATQVFRGTKRERQSETQRKADKNSSLWWGDVQMGREKQRKVENSCGWRVVLRKRCYKSGTIANWKKLPGTTSLITLYPLKLQCDNVIKTNQIQDDQGNFDQNEMQRQ